MCQRREVHEYMVGLGSVARRGPLQDSPLNLSKRTMDGVYMHWPSRPHDKMLLHTQINTFVQLFERLGGFMVRCVEVFLPRKIEMKEIIYQISTQPILYGRNGVNQYNNDKNPVTREFIIMRDDLRMAMSITYFQNSNKFEV
jgi:hypothetical protein